jgi:hypothetical protein
MAFSFNIYNFSIATTKHVAVVEKLKKRRIGKKKIPLSSTNQKTAF